MLALHWWYAAFLVCLLRARRRTPTASPQLPSCSQSAAGRLAHPAPPSRPLAGLHTEERVTPAGPASDAHTAADRRAGAGLDAAHRATDAETASDRPTDASIATRGCTGAGDAILARNGGAGTASARRTGAGNAKDVAAGEAVAMGHLTSQHSLCPAGSADDAAELQTPTQQAAPSHTDKSEPTTLPSLATDLDSHAATHNARGLPHAARGGGSRNSRQDAEPSPGLARGRGNKGRGKGTPDQSAEGSPKTPKGRGRGAARGRVAKTQTLAQAASGALTLDSGRFGFFRLPAHRWESSHSTHWDRICPWNPDSCFTRSCDAAFWLLQLPLGCLLTEGLCSITRALHTIVVQLAAESAFSSSTPAVTLFVLARTP